MDGKLWPIRFPMMYVRIGFMDIFDYFQIFPDDKARISFYMEGRGDPQSVVISPFMGPDAVIECEP